MQEKEKTDRRREIPAAILGVGLMALMVLGMLAWVALLVFGPHAGAR